MVVDYGNVLGTDCGLHICATCNMDNLVDIKEIKSNNMSKETKAENLHASPADTIVEDYCDIMIDEIHRGLYMSSIRRQRHLSLKYAISGYRMPDALMLY